MRSSPLLFDCSVVRLDKFSQIVGYFAVVFQNFLCQRQIFFQSVAVVLVAVYDLVGVLILSALAVAVFAFAVAVRLLLLLLGMSLLTLTTATLDITDAFEYLLRPFRRIGVPAHELSMMMGIALRFLPQFTFELQTVYRAQISRGATFSKGRLRMLASLMVPLFTSAFRHAETLSSAMDARCYHGGIGRTRLHPLTFTRLDRNGTLVIVAMLACVIATNFIPW